MIKIEIPNIRDLKEIDKIALQVHECHVKWIPDIFIHTDSIYDIEDLQYFIDEERIFVYKIDNLIVGYILIYYKNMPQKGYRHSNEILIDALGVLEEYRNQGIGTKLLEFIKEYAMKQGYTNIRLTVNQENEIARHLYEKVGFKVKNISYSMPLDKKK